jgi:probable phosphoglycerate mutase
MELLFARHGNTFNPGDKVVWVGRETDLPLVEKGLAQAAAAAEALRSAQLIPDVIYAASLQRTRRFAEIIAETLGLGAPIVDPRLDELDYGRWAGRTNDEIALDGPAAIAAMEAWNKSDQWPEDAGWGSRKADVFDAIGHFAVERLGAGGHRRPLVVSSNGILRFLPRFLLSPLARRDSFKMRTGHLGIIDCQDGDACLRCWDKAPADLGDQSAKSA